MHGRLRRWSRWHWRIGSYGSHGYGVHHAFVLGLLLLVALVDAASDATTYGDATDTDENDEPNGSAIASVAVADIARFATTPVTTGVGTIIALRQHLGAREKQEEEQR